MWLSAGSQSKGQLKFPLNQSLRLSAYKTLYLTIGNRTNAIADLMRLWKVRLNTNLSIPERRLVMQKSTAQKVTLISILSLALIWVVLARPSHRKSSPRATKPENNHKHRFAKPKSVHTLLPPNGMKL